MARPTRINVNAGDNSWEAGVNTNFQQIYDRPLPVFVHAGTLSSLESARPAASYEWCVAVVDYDGDSTPGKQLAFSNGTAWKLISNWEFFNRRTFRSVSSGTSVTDTDDVIVTTGASSFTIVLPAISNANEGRRVTVKHRGTGTITIDATGADTIDGSATYDIADTDVAFDFIAQAGQWIKIGGGAGSGGGVSDFTDLGDVPASYTGEGLKLVRVNAAEDALEFVTASAGVTDFVDLGDVPTSYTGEGLKVVRVNSAEDALEFATLAAGATDFTDLGDVPSSYTGHSEKFVRVNTGETALEFVDAPSGGGGALKAFSQSLTGTISVGPTDQVIPLDVVKHIDSDTFTYDGTADDVEVLADGVYYINFTTTCELSSGTLRFASGIKVDDGGGFDADFDIYGFAHSNTRHSVSGCGIRSLVAGDKIHLYAVRQDGTGVFARTATTLNILKIA